MAGEGRYDRRTELDLSSLERGRSKRNERIRQRGTAGEPGAIDSDLLGKHDSIEQRRIANGWVHACDMSTNHKVSHAELLQEG
jgi:hypothetical protein